MTLLAVPTTTLPDAHLLVLGLAAEGLTDFQIATMLQAPIGRVRARMEEMLAALGVENRAHAVAFAYRAGWLKRVPSPPRGPAQTERRLQVLRLLVAGKKDPEICVELGIGRNGLEKHLRTVYRQLRVRNRAHLIRIAVDTGLVDLAELEAPS